MLSVVLVPIIYLYVGSTLPPLESEFDLHRLLKLTIESELVVINAGGPVVTPLLYLRGGAERGGPIGAYTDGLHRAGVTDVRAAVIAGAGHFPHEEDPAATWRAISGFIAASPAGKD